MTEPPFDYWKPRITIDGKELKATRIEIGLEARDEIARDITDRITESIVGPVKPIEFSTMMEVSEQFAQWMQAVNDLPPRPRLIRASHLVPYGKAYRYWDTRGDLIVYCNRGELHDLPVSRNPDATDRLTAIPVVLE